VQQTRTLTPLWRCGRVSVVSRVGGEAWADETPDQKIQALVTAASMIDALPLIGEPSSDTQSMQFPRDGDDEIPLAVWKANIVLALDVARKRQAGTVDVVNPAISTTKRAKVATTRSSSSSSHPSSPTRTDSRRCRSRFSGC
jgi:hypothetical protein